MKRTRHISLIIALLSVLGMMAQQQQSQYALYNYRNDGDFNAWLNIDIDSITYSNIGLDSIEYDNLVTQEVWTPDSCYRIPLEAIDSIGFRAPEPEYQDDVFHITIEHIPYITAVDKLTITFYSSLPVLMRPTVGQIVTSDTFEEPLTDGFAGRVSEIIDDGEHVTIVCEGVNVTDVFKKLILVGKAVAVDEEEAKRRPLRRPRNIWGGYEDSGDVEFEFPGKISVKINDFISIDDEVSMAADYYVYVDLPRFKVRATATGTHNLKTSWSIDSDKILKWMGVERDKFEPDWATPVWPVVNIPGVFNFGIRAGAFLDPSVKLSLTGSTPMTFTHTFGFEISNTDTYVFLPLILPIVNVQSELGTPEISLSLEGKLFTGIALGVKTTIIGDMVLSGDITGRFGPEFDAKIQMKQVLGEDEPITWYSLLKDSKVGIQLKADAKVKAKVFGENMTDNLSWDWKWPIPGWEVTRYLFPDFTKPELPHYLMPEPLDMHTTPHRDIIMPIYAGLGIYDEEGTQLRAYYSGEKYVTDAYYKRPPHVFIGDLPVGQKFTCRPIFNLPSFPDIGEIKALPITEFTVPEPMTIGIDTPLNSVTLKKGQVLYVALNGGWGEYSAIPSFDGVCTADIIEKSGMPQSQRYVKIVASKYMAGSSTVTVKDLRSGETKTILVTVSNDAVPEEFTLSEQTVSLQEDESTTVLVTSGSGNYTAESSNENVATATVEDDMITITAISIGSATITVTDTETEETATIEVTVKEAGGGVDIFEVDLPPSTTLSPEIQWEADIMVFNNGERYNSNYLNQVIGTPPSDTNGNKWYAQNYQLTNSEKTWNVGKSPFSSDATYSGKPSTQWTTDGIMADIYLRRTFTVDHELSDKILFSCCHDDAPAEWYLNGVLIRSIDDGWNYDDKVYLTPEQCALIHTDGTKNVLAIHVHNNWGGAFADGGLYDEGKIPVEIGLPPSTTVSPDVQWKADMMVFNGERYASDVDPLYSYSNQLIGTPPSDAQGNEWYARNYQLTDGEKSWGVGRSPFYSYATYKGKPSTQWTPDWYMADIYLRRYFVVDHELSDKIMFSCSHDDAPAEWYLNGVLIRSIEDGCAHHDEDYDSWTEDESTYLTPEQRALIYTDGRVNVLAIHVHNNWGVGFADGGFYEVP